MQYNEQNHVKGGVLLFLFYFQSATDCVKLFFKEKNPGLATNRCLLKNARAFSALI